MSCHLETLESRTLFAATVTSVVQTDYTTALYDVSAVKAAAAAVAGTSKADAKPIAADTRDLGKSKANTAALAAVNKALAKATSADDRDAVKLVAAGRGDLAKAKAAFLAYAKSSTAGHLSKLNATLYTLSTALTPLENNLTTDVGTGDTAVAQDLTVLEGDNPGATTLAGHVTAAEDDQSTAADGIAAGIDTLNADVEALVAAVTS